MKTIRDDIQSIRGIAVVLVVNYHFGIPGFKNGFAGVDIFLVISGYLIAQQLKMMSERGLEGFLKFARSRFWRLYPALMGMIISCALLSYYLQTPDEFSKYIFHAFSSFVFLSNLVFWSESGYFDIDSHTKALLHTWSLSLEFQYYLFFSIIYLFLFVHLRRNFAIIVISSLACFSFILCAALTDAAQVSAFYLLPFRIWEFLLGAFVALFSLKLDFMKVKFLFISIAFLFSLLFVVDIPISYFPGYFALIPTIPVVFLLSIYKPGAEWGIWNFRPLVFLGNISYSLYLWHWPVYVFSSALGYAYGGLLSWSVMWTVSVFLGFLSFRFIETPFRRNSNAEERRSIAHPAAAAMVASMLLVISFVIGAGFLTPKTPLDTQLILKEVHNINPRRDECFFGQSNKSTDMPFCELGAKEGEPTFIVWGDSHADAMMTAVGTAAEIKKRKGVFAGYSGCPPVNGYNSSPLDACSKFIERTYDFIIKEKDISDVIMIARWSYYIFGDVGAGRANLSSLSNLTDDLADVNLLNYRVGILETVCGMVASGKNVFLMEPVPEVGENVPGALAAPKLSVLHKLLGRDRELRVSIGEYEHRNSFVLRIFRDSERQCGAKVLATSRYLCDEGLCKVDLNGRPLYRDADHLSEYGAAFLRPMLDEIFLK